jgi:hypothetical protein
MAGRRSKPSDAAQTSTAGACQSFACRWRCFFQRARTALRAILRRCSEVSRAALVLPPRFPQTAN